MATATTRTFLDPRPIILVVGVWLIFLGAALLIPALVNEAATPRSSGPIFIASLVTMTVGAFMFLATRGASSGLTTRQAFLMTVLVWTSLSVFGALPFYWSGVTPTFTSGWEISITARHLAKRAPSS
mgnify:CR=1 FL=1